MPRPPDVRGPPTAAPQCPLLVPVQAVQPLRHLLRALMRRCPGEVLLTVDGQQHRSIAGAVRCPRQHMAQGEHDGVADRITFQQRPDQRDECRDVVMKPGVQTLPW